MSNKIQTFDINGFYLINDFLTEKEERNLIKNIDKRQWVIDYKRRLQYYGYRNELVKPYDLVAIPNKIPYFIKKLIDRLINEKIIDERPDQVIINEYKPGEGLMPHRDRVSYFKNTIIGISLLSGTVMEFLPLNFDNKLKKKIYIPRRSLYIMKDEARNKWLHGIPGRKVDIVEDHILPRNTRVSITFRNVIHKKVKHIPQL